MKKHANSTSDPQGRRGPTKAGPKKKSALEKISSRLTFGRRTSELECQKMMIQCLPQQQNKRRCGEFSSFAERKLERDDNVHLVSAKLNELSLEERAQVEYELHGVADVQKETPEMLATRKEEMNETLSCFVRASNSHMDTAAYEKALKMSKDYVEGLKATFLRAERFNSREAAARLVRFFDRKRSLFGQQKLVQPIRLQDFEGEEMEAIRKGAVMLLPQRDRAGRSIVVVNGRVNELFSTKTMMRILLYVTCVAAQDVEGTQKSGVVIIYYGFGQTRTIKGRPVEFWLSWRSMPIRIVSCHYCGNGTVLTPAVRQFFALAERLTVCRFRCHYGPQIECLYQLMTFGIPVNDAMPITADGFIDLKHNHKTLRAWQSREAEEDASMPPLERQARSDVKAITKKSTSARPTTTSPPLSPTGGKYVIPGTMDILMGRGLHPKSRPGTLRMHELLLEYRTEYEAASKFDKTILATTILKRLKISGCRFIKSSDGGYEVCDDEVARGKISHGFRNLRLKEGGNNTRPKKDSAKATKRKKPSK